jgi:hypothetical protein
MSTPVESEIVARVTEALDALGVRYYIGGSLASSTHGLARSTVDVDLVAELRTEHAERLAGMLSEDFYVDAGMIRDAVRERGSFNVIHFATTIKIDVFIPKARGLDRAALQRTVQRCPYEDDDREFPLASAEDIILSKLEWYCAGGETSERQWTDVIGVMKIQANHLDWDYLQRWAPELGITDLLNRARREAEA